MPTPILMPKLSDDMREGKILAWKKKEGEAVESGEVIAEVETDKANLEVEAYNAGTLVRIIAPVGTTVPCGQPIAEVAEEGEASSPAQPAPPAPEKQAPPAAPRAAVAEAVSKAAEAPQLSAGAAEQDERVRASPLAKRMAREGNLDLRALEGSGPGGRVVKADVERALSHPAPKSAERLPPAAREEAPSAAPAALREPAPELRDVELPMSGMRRAIARRMAIAKPGSPHFYLTIEIEMTRALELRKQINTELAPDWGGNVSVNDLLLRAAALALSRRPEVNSSFAGESVKRHGQIHLGFALAVEDGLLTPVIRDASHKSLGQISREARALTERGRARKLKPEEYQGGTFTLSNLGMYGVREFSAIINPGEAAILAVGAIEKRPIVVEDQIRVGNVLSATLSGDHRVIDGALGAQLLQEFKKALEQPLRLLG